MKLPDRKVLAIAVAAITLIALLTVTRGPIATSIAVAAFAVCTGHLVRHRRQAPTLERIHVERLGGCALGQREALHVVEVDGTRLVLGVTAASITLLDRVERDRAGHQTPKRAALARIVVLLLMWTLPIAAHGQSSTESADQIVREGTNERPADRVSQSATVAPSPVELPAREPIGGTVVWIALLAVLPFVLMSATSFVKISVVLALLRNALGTPQVPSDPVLAGIALALTSFVMSPVLTEMRERVEASPASFQTAAGAMEGLAQAAEPLKAFMQRNSRPDEVALFVELSKHGESPAAEAGSLTVLMPAFVTSELREAFVIGFLLFLPFLVVDLVAANILMSMGMVMVSPASVSLPFKILLFVLIDGWPLLMKGLAMSYR